MKKLLAHPSATRTVMWFAILTSFAAVGAYCRVFSGFTDWDDEGTLMMMVKQYLGGTKLYEQIYSGYGPVYFFFNGLVRSITGSALDHNSVRIGSAVMSLLCPLICAGIVLRLTKSLVAASIVHLAAFRILSFFSIEPGVPQELCLLLLLCLAGSGVVTTSRRYVWLSLAAAGSIAAALTLIKINTGIFAILAVASALLFQSPSGWFWRAVRYLTVCATVVFPFMLMRVHLNDPAAQTYCLLVTASIAGVLIATPGMARPGTLSVRECLAAVGGFAVTFGLVLAVLAWQGVPMRATLNMLLLEHVRINVSQGFWYEPVKLGRIWIVWAVAGMAAAAFVARFMRGRERSTYRLLAPYQVLLGGAGILSVVAMPSLLLGLVTPFSWLLLYPGVQSSPREDRARILICVAAVLQTLYAYPIAGSQDQFLRVFLALVSVIVWSDGLQSMFQPDSLTALGRRRFQLAAAITLAAVVLGYSMFAYRNKRIYASLTPLEMAGAERIHLEKPLAEEYQWLVSNLRRHCDTFVSLPGIPSLYFWAGKPLPGVGLQSAHGLNIGNWMYTFSDAEQQVIAEDLARRPNVCAVYYPTGVALWNKGKLDVRRWPLANFILTQFKTIGQRGDYQFMIRNERQLEISSAFPPDAHAGP